MRVVKGIALLAIVAVLVVAVGAVGVLVVVTARALPQESGTARVPGLGTSVTVVRDAAGIAHITADTPHDLFFAQGYVHASERMWQMEVWRHISAGRLAELFGESEVDTDRFIRTLGWRVAAQRDLDAYAPATRAVLDAYTAGVNAWLDGHRDSLGLAFLAEWRHPRAVDRPRHRGVGQGPGLEPRRQLRHRGLPLPGRRHARRPGPDRRALPGVPGGGAGDHPDRPAGIGRRRGHGGGHRRGRSRRPGWPRPPA